MQNEYVFQFYKIINKSFCNLSFVGQYNTITYTKTYVCYKNVGLNICFNIPVVGDRGPSELDVEVTPASDIDGDNGSWSPYPEMQIKLIITMDC